MSSLETLPCRERPHGGSMAVEKDPLKRMGAIVDQVDDACTGHRYSVLAERSKFEDESVVSTHAVYRRA